MLRTLALLITVAQTTARANNAPVCAIGLKKGARVRLPQGARKASPALQTRVRKQLPIPIVPGAHVATLKHCREDVGAFRQTCCALPAALPFVHNGTEHFNTTAVAGQEGAADTERGPRVPLEVQASDDGVDTKGLCLPVALRGAVATLRAPGLST